MIVMIAHIFKLSRKTYKLAKYDFIIRILDVIMDIEALRLFVLAADKGNISAAGRILGLVPSVASARLAKLEKQIGADLLHRSTRKVSLSLQGEQLLPYARDIVAQEDAACAALGLNDAVVTGTIRLAAPSTFAQLYICPLIPKFISLYPDLNLDLRLSDSQFDLIDGSFDLALRNTAMKDSSLIGKKLSEDIRVLCAAPEYLRENGEPKDVDDLKNHQLISFINSRPKNLVSLNGKAEIFDPQSSKSKLIFDDGLSQKIATISGAGISINSIWSIANEIKTGELVRVLPQYKAEQETALWLVYPKSNVLTAKVRIFIDFLIAEIQPKLRKTLLEFDC